MKLSSQVLQFLKEFLESLFLLVRTYFQLSLSRPQIYFVNQIVEYIVHNGMMKDLSVLQEAPFTDYGSIVEVFTDLSLWAGIRKAIERVNRNAYVA